MRETISTDQAITFRLPMAVTQMRVFDSGEAYPVCPRCMISLDREYQSFCDRCGQRLKWTHYKQAKIIPIRPRPQSQEAKGD